MFIIQIHKSLTFVGVDISHLLFANLGETTVIVVAISVLLGVPWDARTGQKVCRHSWCCLNETLQIAIRY